MCTYCLCEVLEQTNQISGENEIKIVVDERESD